MEERLSLNGRIRQSINQFKSTGSAQRSPDTKLNCLGRTNLSEYNRLLWPWLMAEGLSKQALFTPGLAGAAAAASAMAVVVVQLLMFDWLPIPILSHPVLELVSTSMLVIAELSIELSSTLEKSSKSSMAKLMQLMDDSVGLSAETGGGVQLGLE